MHAAYVCAVDFCQSGGFFHHDLRQVNEDALLPVNTPCLCAGTISAFPLLNARGMVRSW